MHLFFWHLSLSHCFVQCYFLTWINLTCFPVVLFCTEWEKLLNSRMVETRRDSSWSSGRSLLKQRHSEQCVEAQVQFAFEYLPRGDSAAFLRNLYQCLINWTVKICFLVVNWNPLCSILWTSFPVTGHHSFALIYIYKYTLERSLLSLSYSVLSPVELADAFASQLLHPVSGWLHNPLVYHSLLPVLWFLL